MYFLCPKHRLDMLQLSESEISCRWFEWMNQAAQLYENRNWHKATSFAGCAMDLSSCALLKGDVNKKNLATHAALSTIYTINLLQHQLSLENANIFSDVFCQRIKIALHQTDAQEWADSCIEAVLNHQKHQEFFNDYLSFPFETAKIIPQTSFRKNAVTALH